MAFLKKCLLFCIGGGAYVGLELLWRGYSHISMFAAAVMSKSEHQIKNLVYRGKQSLKAILEQEGFEYADE